MPRHLPAKHSRSHDYGHLVRRWRALARARRLSFAPYASADGYEIYCAETKRPDPDRPWIYLSAGIHGDEPAATEACLEWLTSTRLGASDFNTMIFPCLNPWGLANNCRLDAAGRDLNRTYNDDTVAQTAAHRARMAGRRFDLALALHEDYDANGVYIYELRCAKPYWAEALLLTSLRHLPGDTRRIIEGRRSRASVVRRRIHPGMMPHHPEAFVLGFEHSDRTFTIETPSEAHIDDRVAAHVAIIEQAVRLCLRRADG